MNRPSTLVIVRHAESERNRAKMGKTYFADDEARREVKGIPDHNISLTTEGKAHAIKTGVYLKKRFGTFDYAYHSGYARTIQTLNGLLSCYIKKEFKRIQVRQNPFIRERDAGFTYEMTMHEAETNFPWLKAYWETVGGFFAQPPGGESLAQVVQRVYMFLNMLFRDRAGEKILVVTHGGTIRVLRFILEHWTYERALKWPPGQTPANCGITVYQYDSRQKRLVLKEYNTLCK
jgi:2,3-bisphosphoglycerate-dependent phosphoglycerate mutase